MTSYIVAYQSPDTKGTWEEINTGMTLDGAIRSVNVHRVPYFTKNMTVAVFQDTPDWKTSTPIYIRQGLL